GGGEDSGKTSETRGKEAFSGRKKKTKPPRHSACEACHGSGAKAGTSAKTCPTCRGRGQVSFQQGFFTVARTCSQCGGQGTFIADPCGDCGGAGTTRKLQTLSIKIPPRVATGSRLKLRNEGESGAKGGQPGDTDVALPGAQ